MGCSSSDSAATAGSTSAVRKGQGILPQPVEWTYFDRFYGRGDSLRQMFEYHGQTNIFTGQTQESWAQKKAAKTAGEFGGLPAVWGTLNGKKHLMGQAAATLRSFGIRYGYYNPKDWRQAGLIDQVVETFGDVLSNMAGVMFAPPEQKPSKMESFKNSALNYGKLIESILTRSGGKFIAGSKVTIADFIMAAYVHNMVDNTANPFYNDVFQHTVGPKFRAYIAVNREEFKALNSKREQKAM